MSIGRLHDDTSIWLKLGLAAGLVVFAVSARLVPHPANFAPLAAVALFGSAIFPRRWAIMVPVAAMVISDLVIGLHPLVLYTWGSFAFIAICGSNLLRKFSVAKMGMSSIAASVLFYVVTNFGVWAQGQMYPMSASGLVQCYINAIPFFRGTLLGDLFYSGLLFGLYALAVSLTQKTAIRTSPISK